MKLSARNVLKGRVVKVIRGATTAHVKIDIGGGSVVTASITALSTHDPDQAFLCADRVALLHDGRLARLGATADVVTPAALRETYGVDVDVVVLTRDGRTVRVCVPSLERRSG